LYGRAGRLTAKNGGFRPGQYAEVAAPHRPFDFIDPPRALEGALDSQIAAVREAMAKLGGAADTKKRRVLL
jgi:hypothetical protein